MGPVSQDARATLVGVATARKGKARAVNAARRENILLELLRAGGAGATEGC